MIRQGTEPTQFYCARLKRNILRTYFGRAHNYQTHHNCVQFSYAQLCKKAVHRATYAGETGTRWAP